MKHFLLHFVCLLGLPALLTAQFSFTNRSNWLAYPSAKSGAPIGVADMDGDGRDDIIRVDAGQTLRIEYQPQSSGLFTGFTYGQLFGTQWSLCVADVDNNGYNDIFTGGGYNGLKLLKANGTGTNYNLTTYNLPSIFLQSSNFADINNDGAADIFACNDDGLSQAYRNLGTGNFTLDPALINTVSTVPSDNSGNYGSVWTDYDNDGDLDLYISKCRQGVSNPNDGRRLNLLFANDGNNSYTDVALEAGLRPLAQSWSTDFADIDNDGDMDCLIVNHEGTNKLYVNNGFGQFTEITAQSGLLPTMNNAGPGIQIKFEDFDNDGYLDILYTTLGNNHCLFRNNGNNTFTNFPNAFPTLNRIHSAATGDLNNDGYVDVIAGFGNSYNSIGANPDNLFINNGGSNKYFKVRLDGTNSNPNGIGARLELYGAWGKQIREVRSGESYGIQTSLTKHFGIGDASFIDSLIVRWPSGTVDKIVNPGVNQTVVVEEGNNCIVSANFNTEIEGLEVTFSDASTLGANQWQWNFGDGLGSTQENPVHSYAQPGVYLVCLQATGLCGTAQYCALVNVSCMTPQSVFGHVDNGLSIQFQDQSFNFPTAWFWTFGDGGSSTLPSPQHTFPQPGSYMVCLTVSNNCGTTQSCDQVVIGCSGAQVGFSYNSTNLSAQFQDLSTGSPTQWLWDFGDGGTSTQQNPAHNYLLPGVYDVCLTVQTVCGPLIVCQNVVASCSPPAIGINYLGSGLSFNFESNAVGPVDTWLWNFGDGSNSPEQNPNHVFPAPGVYQVCLTATGACGSTELCIGIVASCAPPAAGYSAQITGLNIQFEDISVGGASTWLWDFGDGATSNVQNPAHTYATAGTYQVCLTASSACGATQVCEQITINCPLSQAQFAFQTNQLVANFVNQSTNNPTTLSWTFGDGSLSNQQNPQHTYAEPGTYVVCLFATNACGTTIQCEQLTLGCAPPQPSFSTQTSGLAVNFTDNSTGSPESWFWEFGDGASSTLPSPQHAFNIPGSYSVCLTVSSICGSMQFCQTVSVSCPAPQAAFSATNNGLQATFTDISTNTPIQWSWIFGDGASSSLQNPQHTYSQPGTYLVCLTSASLCGSNQSCQQVTISCAAPQAFFNVAINGLAVSFTDLSGNTPSSWQWNFGDGLGSIAQNPNYTYTEPGTYQVCLQANSMCGASQFCQTITVTCAAPQPAFSFQSQQLSVSFSDLSANSPTSWAWTFGDGGSSSAQHPQHTYTQPGNYQVCLTASSNCGDNQLCLNVQVTCFAPQANFEISANELSVEFTDESTNDPGVWNWSFGDGANSNLQNPQHEYALPGLYLVCLNVSNACGNTQRCEQIQVTCAAPQANFSLAQTGTQTLSFTQTSSNDPDQWFWNFGDGTSSTEAHPVHNYTAPGEYEVCLTVANECGNDQFCTTVNIECFAPQAAFSPSGSGINLLFLDASQGAPSNWQWDFGDGTSSNQQNPFHNYAGPGTFEVCLIASNICGSDTICQTILVTTTALQNPGEGALTWSMSPNPSTDIVHWQCEASAAEQGQLLFYNALGMLLKKEEISWSVGKTTLAVDLSSFSGGTYWVGLLTKGGIQIKKLVKQ